MKKMKKMKKLNRIFMLCAATLLFACQGFAEETAANPAAIKKEDCALTLGREFPGAKGSLKTDENGNVVIDYDFTNGGRYVGAEIKLPAAGLKSYTLTFEPKQAIRCSVVVIQPEGRIETKRNGFGAAEYQIVVNSKTQFLKPGSTVSGNGTKIMFRLEKSTNAATSGSVILKSISY